MSNIRDVLILAESLCVKLLDKKDWDCSNDAEKLKQMIVEHIHMLEIVDECVSKLMILQRERQDEGK